MLSQLSRGLLKGATQCVQMATGSTPCPSIPFLLQRHGMHGLMSELGSVGPSTSSSHSAMLVIGRGTASTSGAARSTSKPRASAAELGMYFVRTLSVMQI